MIYATRKITLIRSTEEEVREAEVAPVRSKAEGKEATLRKRDIKVERREIVEATIAR